MNENNSLLQATVIIPVWNGCADLPTCLTALMEQTGVTFEVIAVDDESSDGSAAYISTHFPQVQLLRTHTNAGFSAACNLGLRHAVGETLVLLNQDTQVKPGWLAALTNTLAQDKQIGIAGSKAFYPDGTIQHVGGEVNAQGYGGHIGAYEPDHGQYEERIDVDYVTGASLAISRKVYQEVGGFDENFDRAYYEDVDLCYRVRDAGYRVIYEPNSVLIHNERSAVVDNSPQSGARLQNNRLRFVFKNWLPEMLIDEFMPAERVWIEHLDRNLPEIVGIMGRAYMRLMMSSAEIAKSRKRRFDDDLDIFLLAQSIWLYLSRQEAEVGINIWDKNNENLVAYIDAIQVLHPIKPQPFRSNIPVIGSFIAGFRRQWNRVAAEWFVVPILQKQNQVNENMYQAFGKVAERFDLQQQDAQLTTAYITELANQISQANQKMQNLKEEITTLKSIQGPPS